MAYAVFRETLRKGRFLASDSGGNARLQNRPTAQHSKRRLSREQTNTPAENYTSPAPAFWGAVGACAFFGYRRAPRPSSESSKSRERKTYPTTPEP